MKILVTGANGYIGKHVVSALLNSGCLVTACDLHLQGIDARAEKVEGDLFSLSDGIFEKLGSPNVCIHLAWRDGFQHNSQNHMGDLSSHYKLLTGMIDSGLKQLVVMGSMHEIGYHEGAINENTLCNPLSMYGIAKDALRRAITLYCESHNCILQWVRGYYILGDDKNNHSIFTKLLEANAAGNEKFPFTTGKAKCDFMSVEELAFQISSVALQKEVAGIINCCSGQPVSLADRVEQYIQEHHLKIKLEYGAYPDRAYDSPIIYGDNSKIKLILKNND